MELWTAFLLGLAGSAHCAGMCGPLVLALPRTEGTPRRLLSGRLLYNAGRIVTYGALGALFGLIGRSLAMIGIQRWVSLGLGLLMLAGLLLSRTQWLRLSFPLPVARLKSGLGYWLRQQGLPALLVLGLLNGLLPCGLVYAAGAAAAMTGGVIEGVTYMLVFGLGTVPMMLGLSLAGSWLHASLRPRLQRIVPIGLAVVAVLLILRGLSLGIPYLSPNLAGGSCPHCP